MKKKHIYLIGSNISMTGGTQRVTVNLANEFIKENNVTIINVGSDTGNKNFEINSNVKIRFLNTDRSKTKNQLLYFLVLFFALKKGLYEINKKNKEEFNVFIGIGIGYSYILGLLNLKGSITIGSQHNPFRSNYIINIIRKHLLSKLDKFVVISEDMYNSTKNLLGLNNIEKISNFINIPKIKKNEKIYNRVLAVGRLSDQKGFDFLVEIWKKVILAGRKEKLTIVGEGELKEELLRKITEYKLEEYIEIVNFTNKINDYYLSSDLYLMSSRHEGLPMVLLEAMSYGLPCISFDCPTGPGELIKNDYNGYLIDCFDVDDFKEKIIDLLKDKEKRRVLGENAIEISKKYSKKKIMKIWGKIMEESRC